MDKGDFEQLKQFLRENLEIIIEYTDRYSSRNDQKVGLKFKGEEDCFTYETVYIPDDNN